MQPRPHLLAEDALSRALPWRGRELRRNKTAQAVRVSVLDEPARAPLRVHGQPGVLRRRGTSHRLDLGHLVHRTHAIRAQCGGQAEFRRADATPLVRAQSFSRASTRTKRPTLQAGAMRRCSLLHTFRRLVLVCRTRPPWGPDLHAVDQLARRNACHEVGRSAGSRGVTILDPPRDSSSYLWFPLL